MLPVDFFVNSICLCNVSVVGKNIKRLVKLCMPKSRIKMKKILILAYDYPPYVSVGGLRPFSWVKYMNEFGVFPVLITRQWSNKYGNSLDYIAAGESPETIVENSDKSAVFKTPYFPKLSHRLLLKYGDFEISVCREKCLPSFYEFGQYIFVIGPKSNLYFEADKYMAKNKIDLIVATGEPYILFRYAAKLSGNSRFRGLPITVIRGRRTKKEEKPEFPNSGTLFRKKKLYKCQRDHDGFKVFSEKNRKSGKKQTDFISIRTVTIRKLSKASTNIRQTSEKLSIGFVGTIYKWHPVESFLRVCNDFAGSFHGNRRVLKSISTVLIRKRNK